MSPVSEIEMETPIEDYHNPIIETEDGRKRRSKKGGREKSKKYGGKGQTTVVSCEHGRRHHAIHAHCQASLLNRNDIGGKFYIQIF